MLAIRWLLPLRQMTSKRIFNSCVLFFRPAMPRFPLKWGRKHNAIVSEIIIKQNHQNILDILEFLYI